MGATLERVPTLIDTTNHLSHELGPRALRERRRMRWRATHGAQTARDLAHHRTVLVRAPPRGAQHERLVGLDRARRRARRAGVARVKRVKVPRFVVALGAPSADVDKRDGLRRSGGALDERAAVGGGADAGSRKQHERARRVLDALAPRHVGHSRAERRAQLLRNLAHALHAALGDEADDVAPEAEKGESSKMLGGASQTVSKIRVKCNGK